MAVRAARAAAFAFIGLCLAFVGLLAAWPVIGDPIERLRRSWDARVAIEGHSMEPALEPGDWLLVDPDAYAAAATRAGRPGARARPARARSAADQARGVGRRGWQPGAARRCSGRVDGLARLRDDLPVRGARPPVVPLLAGGANRAPVRRPDVRRGNASPRTGRGPGPTASESWSMTRSAPASANGFSCRRAPGPACRSASGRAARPSRLPGFARVSPMDHAGAAPCGRGPRRRSRPTSTPTMTLRVIADGSRPASRHRPARRSKASSARLRAWTSSCCTRRRSAPPAAACAASRSRRRSGLGAPAPSPLA